MFMTPLQKLLHYMFPYLYFLWRLTTMMCATSFRVLFSIYMFIVPSSAEPADGWSYYIFVSVFIPCYVITSPLFQLPIVKLLFYYSIICYLDFYRIEPIIPCWFYKWMCGDPFILGGSQCESYVLLEDENNCSLAWLSTGTTELFSYLCLNRICILEVGYGQPALSGCFARTS